MSLTVGLLADIGTYPAVARQLHVGMQEHGGTSCTRELQQKLVAWLEPAAQHMQHLIAAPDLGADDGSEQQPHEAASHAGGHPEACLLPVDKSRRVCKRTLASYQNGDHLWLLRFDGLQMARH